jgi:hypothetical protein
VEPNTSHLQDGSGPGQPGPSAAAAILARFRKIGRGRPAAAPVLTPFGRYCASVLAATAIESGVDEDGIRRLFARCAEVGYGFPAECEAAVLAEHAALRAS